MYLRLQFAKPCMNIACMFVKKSLYKSCIQNLLDAMFHIAINLTLLRGTSYLFTPDSSNPTWVNQTEVFQQSG